MTVTLLIGLWSGRDVAVASQEEGTADLLIKLLKAGRGVISDYQAIINDASKGDKGFTPNVLAKQTIVKFRSKTHIDLTRLPDTPRSRLLLVLLESEKEVVDDFQLVINKQGIAFKRVLPVVFARIAGEKFYRKTGIRLKLTSRDPRFRGNKADRFEAGVLALFQRPNYPRGKYYRKMTTLDGKPVLRVMSPEYAEVSCLKCHGTPKGDRDMTGGIKEGWKEGDLGGAISLVMPVK